MSNLTSALIITGIGMGLVFIAILLLWGMMELLGRAFPEKEAEAAEEAASDAPAAELPAQQALTLASKAAAAAAAVAVAMALRPVEEAPQVLQAAQSPAASVSVWQAALRANRLNLRSGVYSRKS